MWIYWRWILYVFVVMDIIRIIVVLGIITIILKYTPVQFGTTHLACSTVARWHWDRYQGECCCYFPIDSSASQVNIILLLAPRDLSARGHWCSSWVGGHKFSSRLYNIIFVVKMCRIVSFVVATLIYISLHVKEYYRHQLCVY